MRGGFAVNCRALGATLLWRRRAIACGTSAATYSHPPLEGEGRRRGSTATETAGWGEIARLYHPTPLVFLPRIKSGVGRRATLPLQGRVKRGCGIARISNAITL